ncbi:unnamed protein product [Notodromas monacha]|uniref:Glycosyltransferase family 92 protein n=1 Tax=Notodromas monacha TaxID=399045 RepID=A0A7R9BBT3_9CRUS|nr:unnamed protein product [Notodromas monacha]CAG0912401.1 unnamed protein product [Notodromas monacha]
MKKGTDCAQLPNVLNLDYENSFWQLFTTKNGTFYLYSAYYDIRPRSPAPTMRILSMSNTLNPTVPVSCQIWFNNRNDPEIAKVVNYRLLWEPSWGTGARIYPYSIECEVPTVNGQNLVPVAVSLVENICDTATNLIKVTHNALKPGEKKSLAVCVKRMYFVNEEPIFKLIEYLELVRILGAEKVYMYVLEPQQSAKIEKIFRYYEAQGLLEVSRITIPGQRPNLPILRHLYIKKHLHLEWMFENIPTNDCLYKSFYRHDLIANIDLDEVIIPENGLSWRQMIQKVVVSSKDTPYSTITTRNSYYPINFPKPKNWNPGVPPQFPMLNTIRRLTKYSKPLHSAKSFFNTENVIVSHSHWALSCLGQQCSRLDVPTEIATSHHYRPFGPDQFANQDVISNATVADYSLWKWKDQLVAKCVEAARDLDFL